MFLFCSRQTKCHDAWQEDARRLVIQHHTMRPDDLTCHYSEVVCGITDNILARTTPKQILDLSDLFLETFRPILIESIDADINKTANENNTKLRFS